ncbi:hypothetical protein SLS63_013202 [Diaporthe eres]|uniref:Allantoate permease n=1 Tax=Diaporthe eres TaxID=83184 RepID=A0ABR1NP63_DIAER
MADKISDSHSGPMGNDVLDNSEKAMDSEKQALKTKDADAALEFLYAEETTIMTDVNEKDLVRKIDWRIVPLMWACYNLQYLDKTLVNYANVMGLREDTSISADQFSQLALVFYVTYLAFEFPTGYLMQRLPTAKYLGANVILWDNPMKCKFLTRDEKVWAVERLRENKTGIENKHFKAHQAWECFKDPQTWLISLITISSNVPNGAVSSYQATIIKNFGYTSKETALLSIPSGAIGAISVLSATYMAGRFNLRGPIIIAYLLLGGVVGGSLLAFTANDSKGAKLAGNYLTNVIGASLPLLYSYSGANYSGHTKKVTMNAILLMSFCLGNIIGPLTFRGKDAPDYIPAKIAIVVTSAFACCMTALLMAYYTYENRRREGLRVEHQENSEFLDLTDKENMEFRYRS